MVRDCMPVLMNKHATSNLLRQTYNNIVICKTIIHTGATDEILVVITSLTLSLKIAEKFRIGNIY